MPTHKSVGESTLRDYLLAVYVDLRQLFTNTLAKDSAESGQYAWDQWTPLIDALLDGEAITFSRYELPPDHPQAAPHGGAPTDRLELGGDDVLRPDPREFGPNGGHDRSKGRDREIASLLSKLASNREM